MFKHQLHDFYVYYAVKSSFSGWIVGEKKCQPNDMFQITSNDTAWSPDNVKSMWKEILINI